MSGNEVWVEGFSKMKADGIVDGSSGATALGDLASFTQDTPYLENVDVFITKYPLWDSFIGLIPGSIGETSALACLIGGALLLWTGIASWRIILSFFVGGFVMAYILNLIGGNGYFDLPAINQLMLGGFFFGMIFMATDPVTSAQTNTGKFIYGFLAGLLGILIRMVNPAYPEGVMLAILIANVTAPTIDHIVIKSNINRRLKRVKTI
jgi:Na+-transporting NADH:ubiquinone oxidoreductase subunit B